MKLEFEYGQGLLGAELTDSTDIFIPGETVAHPPSPGADRGDPPPSPRG